MGRNAREDGEKIDKGLRKMVDGIGIDYWEEIGKDRR